MGETMTCYRHPDRETGLSCSECGRPICVDCMSVAPVGIRCPDHAGARPKAGAGRRPARGGHHAPDLSRYMRTRVPHDETLVTKVLIGLCVALYVIGVAQGAGVNDPGGELYARLWLWGPEVADGDWWRLLTSAFLHASLLHIAFNMLALWWIGGPVETVLGRWRYLGLFLVSGLAGAAGALLAEPGAVTVGASGGIFGLLGAMLVIQRQYTGSFAGPALTLILINLVFTFAIPGISWGGHLGGLVGGILATLALTRLGRAHPTYGRAGLAGVAALFAIGVLSIAIAYWKVKGYA